MRLTPVKHPIRHLLHAGLVLAVCVLAAPQAAEAKTKKVTADQTFVQVRALTASIGGPYRFSGLMVVEFGLEIPDEKLRAKAESMGPRLRDAHANAMTQYAMTYYKPGTVPNADDLAKRLQKSTDLAMGQKGAKVLLGSNLVRSTSSCVTPSASWVAKLTSTRL